MVHKSCTGPHGQVWFAAINFVGDEAYHPLDFFSNKMRTRRGGETYSLCQVDSDSVDSLNGWLTLHTLFAGGHTGTLQYLASVFSLLLQVAACR